ncbi:response regulator transcription factor [Pseudonocardia humida]|uniref:Response regulator transcription factor n=1 Tax=Pseudonocardia humida TaxID=2800819 RepID=A0ABT0ZT21_9PSEU|nr:response regulator transcription factor [Pseudonocardia humida]MCO1653869.1 response regulator transcription factor [Pseudonocardia humida]
MTAPARVLIVEDDVEISYLIELALADAHLDVRTVGHGDQALSEVHDWAPDVVLLDLSIPGPDGLEVCRRLRQFSDAYVLMLTGRADEVDKVIGLSIGADDYLTKPFSPRELAARVQAMLRRPHELPQAGQRRGRGQQPDGHPSGSLEIDVAAREVRVRGTLIALTKIEFDLLAALAEDERQVRTRDQLRERVWGGAWLADEHAVDVHMSNLRRKLAAAGEGQTITTVRGVGYRITPLGGP